MKELILKKNITIKAPVSKVWDALTKPEWTNKYMFNCDAISEWKKGSHLIWKGHQDGKVYVKGQIVDIKPKQLLEFTTFDPNGELPDIPDNYTKVSYKLASENGHTKLFVSDGDFSKVGNGEKRYQETVKGWEVTLNKLKEEVEK
jgi:uncharacterized protein YndB with AHSA1/START domain